jgi:hypothetical protein
MIPNPKRRKLNYNGNYVDNEEISGEKYISSIRELDFTDPGSITTEAFDNYKHNISYTNIDCSETDLVSIMAIGIQKDCIYDVKSIYIGINNSENHELVNWGLRFKAAHCSIPFMLLMDKSEVSECKCGCNFIFLSIPQSFFSPDKSFLGFNCANIKIQFTHTLETIKYKIILEHKNIDINYRHILSNVFFTRAYSALMKHAVSSYDFDKFVVNRYTIRDRQEYLEGIYLKTSYPIFGSHITKKIILKCDIRHYNEHQLIYSNTFLTVNVNHNPLLRNVRNTVIQSLPHELVDVINTYVVEEYMYWISTRIIIPYQPPISWKRPTFQAGSINEEYIFDENTYVYIHSLKEFNKYDKKSVDIIPVCLNKYYPLGK